ncbi:MAG: AAA family ATPase [Candidatus Aminicenantes bacterium]|nr:AAA family ATPase [Candidatus Aminicenantes bacterium]MDH5704748.1 AAA family ATPase [Candidatus Aminicenantes bacterium]
MPKLEMSLIDYLRVIRKRMRIIVLSFILVISSTIFFTTRQTPIYSTSCKVKIEQRKSVAEVLTELITWSPGDEMTSQANFIKSYQIMEKVAEALDYIKPAKTDKERDDPGRIAIIKGLQAKINTEQVEYTNIIAITATSSNPEEAMKLVNTTAKIYAQTHYENKIQEASQLKQFVKEQLDSYLRDLQVSQNELLRFRQENPLIVERDITSPPPLETDPRIISLKEEIVNTELQLITLKSRYTDEHPEVIAIKRKLDESKKNLSEAISQLSEQHKDFSTKEIRLIQLKRNVKVAEDIYYMFRTKYEEARILEAEKARDVEIIEPAQSPTKPVKPNVNFNILIGIISGLLVGMVLAFVTESFDTSIGRIDDIEELIKVPVLGIIPNTAMEKTGKRYFERFRKKAKIQEGGLSQERLVVLFEPNSIAAEAYKTLRTNLDLTGLKKFGNCIVITSSAPQEGKTQTLCNLAIAFAQSGQKTLIVGSDFRKPVIYKLFGVPRSPGLSEVLIGNVPWKDAINTTTDMLLGKLQYDRIIKTKGIENLHIMTCGEHTPNPSELLSFSEMSMLLKELKQNYDLILLDSAPTLPVTDSAILGAKADGAIIVYQAGKTSRNALLRAKIQLENVNVRVLGIVINNLKARFVEDVTPSQRYRYYRYYGEKREQK